MCGVRTNEEFNVQICSSCRIINQKARDRSVSLAGKSALVTGCRIKIGYEVSLKLLRCGAKVKYHFLFF